jgi:hypothetical protein
VLLSFLDPLLAVVALSTGHTPIVMMEPRRRISIPILSAARHAAGVNKSQVPDRRPSGRVPIAGRRLSADSSI